MIQIDASGSKSRAAAGDGSAVWVTLLRHWPQALSCEGSELTQCLKAGIQILKRRCCLCQELGLLFPSLSYPSAFGLKAGEGERRAFLSGFVTVPASLCVVCVCLCVCVRLGRVRAAPLVLVLVFKDHGRISHSFVHQIQVFEQPIL